MANKMLIDATHPEETRVVVVRGNRIEEFDFEAASKKQLRGNIYLARVTRVEPSLQAAFVDYGGNRHGFLAFSEIHPDYYQIPVADRQALLDEEAEDDSDDEDGVDNDGAEDRDSIEQPDSDSDDDDTASRTRALAANGEDVSEDDDGDTDDDGEDGEDTDVAASDVTEVSEDDQVESVGSEDALEEVPRRAPRRKRSYKIQEVIKRKQVLLVQVVKEERGNKGAALTTYLSLAGRYCVLMPNTARGGGISRKITASGDRKRLKDVARELEVPAGMGVILRTAGASRTKTEIRRDFEYLLRLWENVRELTLESMAPTLVYEEGNLVKRAIRDLYNKDIDQVQVSGDGAYREAKDFMRMLMPSHAKNVQLYKENDPIFIRNGIEGQLDAMFSAEVTLKSGGYIVINQTEALVAIDVNSGKSTREHSIEDTALRTNLEAAAEITRQLRLRDLAGLIVIDFIDMDENRNNRAVERKLKECLKSDRARIQVGRISHFGLLEMSRQRIRSGIMEGSFETCSHCTGSGIVRSTASVALHVLRSIEEELRKRAADIAITTRAAAALYILNEKRDHLVELEQRYGVHVTVRGDDSITNTLMTLERHAPARTDRRPETRVVTSEGISADALDEDAGTEEETTQTRDSETGGGRKRRRRRRGGRQGETDVAAATSGEDADDNGDTVSEASDGESERADGEGSEDRENGRRRRRRGRRGGRRRRGQQESGDNTAAEANADGTGDGDTSPANDNADASQSGDESKRDSDDEVAATDVAEADASTQPDEIAEQDEAEKPKPRKHTRRKPAAKSAAETSADAAEGEAEAPVTEKPKRAPRKPRKTAKQKAEEDAAAELEAAAKADAEADTATNGAEAGSTEAEGVEAEPVAEATPAAEVVAEPAPEDAGPPRRGWWQRALRGDS